MRAALLAIVIGTGLGVLNHVAVIAGFMDPPAGHEPAWFLRNLDVPQYLTWGALARDHWLLPNFHAPWKTEPALFQPMLQIVGKSGLPPLAAHYGLQLLLYWVCAYALILAARTFCRSRRHMVYAAIAMIGALPLKLIGWAFAKWAGAAMPLQLGFAYGVIEYAYETADGFLRGGLSNSFTLTFGTAVTLFAFTALAKYLRTGVQKYFKMLLFCTFFGALLHPFEVFLIVLASAWPLWTQKKTGEILALAAAGALGILPYLIQSVRSEWLRDASDLAQWHMPSPAWVLLAFGLPAILICWLMALRFRGPEPEDDVLQSWFLTAALLPMISAVPVAIHLFDGFTYCLGFLLVRKTTQDPLFRRYSAELRPLAWGWAAVSAAVLATVYVQLYHDGKTPEPLIGRPAVVATDERRMLEWMGNNLGRDKLVLAPLEMAPWVAAVPLPALASHDVFSITFDEQRDAVLKFYGGDGSVIDRYGVSYAVSEKPLAAGELLHREGRLLLYSFPSQERKPYPGHASLSGTKSRNAFRQWLFALLGATQ